MTIKRSLLPAAQERKRETLFSSSSSSLFACASEREFYSLSLSLQVCVLTGIYLLVVSYVTGNLGRVDRINDFEYDLFVRPDVANPRYRFWFNFTIENVQQGQVITSNHESTWTHFTISRFTGQACSLVICSSLCLCLPRRSQSYKWPFLLLSLFPLILLTLSLSLSLLAQRVLLTVVNFDRPCPLFSDGLTPVIRSTSRPKW